MLIDMTQKNSQKWKFQFLKISNFTILDSKALPGEGPKISDNFEAMTKIKDIFLNRMKRAHGICQQTLKLPDRKMRSEPYLRRETFLLSHPLHSSHYYAIYSMPFILCFLFVECIEKIPNSFLRKPQMCLLPLRQI